MICVSGAHIKQRPSWETWCERGKGNEGRGVCFIAHPEENDNDKKRFVR